MSDLTDRIEQSIQLIREQGIEGALVSLNIRVMELQEKLSEPPTTVSRTKAYPLAAESYKESGMEDITAAMPVSSQSDRVGTESGRVEPASECAHEWAIHYTAVAGLNNAYLGNLPCLKGCGALRSFVLTPVPAAAPSSSTSARPGLNKSAER